MLVRGTKINFDFIDWNTLVYNENAIEFFRKFPFRTKFYYLANNPNPNVVPLLFDNLESVDMSSFCSRNEPEILSYIQEHFINLINNPWNFQSICENKDAFYIIEQHIPYLQQKDANNFWIYISKNENAIELLHHNIDKIYRLGLSSNPAIFILDKEEMKKQSAHFTINLISYFCNPERIKRFCEIYNVRFEEFFNNY